ncbi:MAG TPA: maltotransferase domain-containing protein [Polyangia bacterium]|nr:maltotransferase domain-containing protein [Polyangia bacterium]
MPEAATTKAFPPGLDGRRRVVVGEVRPSVDGGRYPVKRISGEPVVVEADLLVDGHDKLAGVLLVRRRGETAWRELPLEPDDNDVWRASFVPDAMGPWELTVSGWVDGYATWAHGLRRKLEAKQDVELDLQAGAALFTAAAERAGKAKAADDAKRLSAVAGSLRASGDQKDRAAAALASEAAASMRAHPDRSMATTWDPPLPLTVDPPLAAFSAWYEMFPRSCGPEGKHGTLRDAEGRLDYIADLGFDVVYLPPIHPIGRTHRKGRDNSLVAEASDPGSPWAIGGAEGGHKAVHPELGTVEDLRRFVGAARQRGLQVALDIAFQTSPDHPYVKEHPEWFVHRADGSVQYAENPPKKYEDIYPFDFAGAAWQSLWQELRSVFLHWIEQGVRVFRVDNPHTKPIPFWHWCIQTIKERHPDVIFLAEAFTRPKLMYVLAKVGFSQSYTYFTWRTSKQELVDYVQTLADSQVRDFFRPNFWPNTPDILPEHLQYGGHGMFIARAVLAATLSPSWGIYGPPFELMEHVSRPGAEEYAQNEKYQLRSWNLDDPRSLRPVIKRLNHIRRENAALHRLTGTTFHRTDNDTLICYSRRSEDGQNLLLIVVNLDPHHAQSGWVDLDLPALGLTPDASFQAHDLIGDGRYLWRGARNFVSLDPAAMPAQIFRLRHHLRTERSFEYYL